MGKNAAVVVAKPPKRDTLDRRRAAAHALAPARDDKQDWTIDDLAGNTLDDFDGRRIGPVKVLDQYEARIVACVRCQQLHDRIARLAPQLLTVGNGRNCWPWHRKAEKLTDQHVPVVVKARAGKKFAQPCRIGLSASILVNADLLLEPPDDRIQGRVAMLLRGLQRHNRLITEAEPVNQLRRQSGFADPGVAGDLHRLPAPGLDQFPCPQKLVDLSAPPDHRKDIAKVLGARSVILCRLACDLEGLHFARQALERMHP
jgi:hypothetical protein